MGAEGNGDPKYRPSEHLQRINQIMQSIEQRKLTREQLLGQAKSIDVQLERVDVALAELRKQLDVELKKFDPLPRGHDALVGRVNIG